MTTRQRRIGGLLAAVAALLAVAAPARADTVTEWNLNATNALIVTAGQPPQVSVPHLAMVHGAVYDAVNAIDGGREGYLLSSRVATPSDSMDAAAATAAYRVLLRLVPAQQATLDAQLRRLTGSDSERVVEDAWDRRRRGRRGGDDRGAYRRRPLRSVPVRGRLGSWRLEAGAAGIRQRSERVAQGREAVPHPELVAVPLQRAARAHQPEVRDASSTRSSRSARRRVRTRTSDQELAARYWAENPPGTWSRIFRTLSAQEGLSLVENARLLRDPLPDGGRLPHQRLGRQGALVILAADHGDPGGRHGREPENAAGRRVGAADSHPALSGAPLGTHRLSGSFVKTLQQFFRKDRIAWSDTNNAGLTRSFTRFSQAIDEIVDARVWSGIHFRTADEQGERIGKQVARYREEHYFQPEHR